MTIVNELNQHGSKLSLRLDLSEFMTNFHRLAELRTTLMGRLRSSGLTVWAALHHLFKQCFNRRKSYRALKESALSLEPPSSPHSATGSLRGSHHHRFGRHPREPSSATNSLHRQQATARQQSKMIADLQSYYSVALVQFNRWLALESYILSYYCAVSFRKVDESSKSSKPSSTTTPTMQPSKVLKFTIRRCEVGDIFFNILVE